MFYLCRAFAMPMPRFSCVFLLFLLHQCAQGWYLDSSCDRPKRTYPSCYDDSEYLPSMTPLVNHTVQSMFGMSQIARDTLDLLSRDKASPPQIDLLDYMFIFAVKDGKAQRSGYLETADSVYEQVLSFNKTRDGSPMPMPSDSSELSVNDVIIFCDYTRFQEGVDCSGNSAPGQACDTFLDFEVNMASLYPHCAEGSEYSGVTFKGQGLRISSIQPCQSLLEQYYWFGSSTWPDVAGDSRLAAVGSISDPSIGTAMDTARVYDHSVLHEMTHAVLRSPTIDVGGPQGYGWRNAERISKESQDLKDHETASYVNAENYAFFALGACLINPPKSLGIRSQRANRDGSVSVIEDPSLAELDFDKLKICDGDT